MSRTFLPLSLILLLAACGRQDAGNDAAVAADLTGLVAEARVSASPGSGVELDKFDINVPPGTDFYRYVNGSWLANTPIPADKSNYGAFTVLADVAEEQLRDIIESASVADSAPGSDAQKVGDFFKSFMDEDRIEELGATPIMSALAEIGAVSSKEGMFLMSADLNRAGVQIPAGGYVNNDEMQSDQYITYIVQSGLGLPDRDWYLSTDNPTHEEARAAYREYMTRVMALADYDRAGQVADSVMAIENRIAAAQWDRVMNRQAELTYNKRTLAELQAMSPGLDWAGFMQRYGVTEEVYIIAQPSYIETIDDIWNAIPLEQWKDYFSYKFVDAYAPYLSNDFVQAQFDFEGRVLSGQDEIEPRWKRGVGVVDASLGEVVGKLYVEQYFQSDAKARMDRLIENLREGFRAGIDELEWMTPETKSEAREKLANFTTKIGYPDEWKDYSALTVDPQDLVGNVMRSRRVEHDRELGKLGNPINRAEWFMTPYTVNAYYNPTMNEVVFPAAILQPPFFNVATDDAVNYGGIGAVIGHEFSHGFDDQGRKYDGNGNLRDWWTEADAGAFSERAGKLVAQYNQIEVLPGKFLDGEFTLGENIGDLSGLAVAYKAYRLSLNGEEPPVIDGFTGDQRFFIGWAQIWRRLYRDENLEVRLTSDPHSHSEARCNAILRNFDPWYAAFNIGQDDPMYLPPQERVRIW
jgi:putative endopeptidase